jgi:hypothetical protein
MNWQRFDDVKPPSMIKLFISIKHSSEWHSSEWHYSECYFNGVKLIKCGTSIIIDTIYNVVYWIKPIPPEEEV